MSYLKFVGDDDKFHALEVDLRAIFFVKSQIKILHSVISRVFFFSPYFRFVGDDDDDNEITDHKTRKITSSDDLGDYVSEQMTWTPSRADLCNFDATVS